MDASENNDFLEQSPTEKFANLIRTDHVVRKWLLNPNPTTHIITQDEINRSFVISAKYLPNTIAEDKPGPYAPNFMFVSDENAFAVQKELLQRTNIDREWLFIVNYITPRFALCTVFGDSITTPFSSKYEKPIFRRAVVELTHPWLMTYQVAWHSETRLATLCHATRSFNEHKTEFFYFDTSLLLDKTILDTNPETYDHLYDRFFSLGQAPEGSLDYLLSSSAQLQELKMTLGKKSTDSLPKPAPKEEFFTLDTNQFIEQETILNPECYETAQKVISAHDQYVARVIIVQISCPYCESLSQSCACPIPLRSLFYEQPVVRDGSFYQWVTTLASYRSNRIVKCELDLDLGGIVQRKTKFKLKLNLEMGSQVVGQFLQHHYQNEFLRYSIADFPQLIPLEEGHSLSKDEIPAFDIYDIRNEALASMETSSSLALSPSSNGDLECLVRAITQMAIPHKMLNKIKKEKLKQNYNLLPMPSPSDFGLESNTPHTNNAFLASSPAYELANFYQVADDAMLESMPYGNGGNHIQMRPPAAVEITPLIPTGEELSFFKIEDEVDEAPGTGSISGDDVPSSPSTGFSSGTSYNSYNSATEALYDPNFFKDNSTDHSYSGNESSSLVTGNSTHSFQCSKCNTVFTRNRDLKKHKETVHNRERKYRCVQCSKDFLHKWHFQLHTKSVHEKLKPYGCELCDKSFARNSDLTKHIRMVHLKLRPFKCEICESSFGQNGDLMRHLRKVHKQDI